MRGREERTARAGVALEAEAERAASWAAVLKQRQVRSRPTRDGPCAGNEKEGRSVAGPPSSGPRPGRGGKKWAGSRDGLKMKNRIFFK